MNDALTIAAEVQKKNSLIIGISRSWGKGAVLRGTYTIIRSILWVF